MVCAAFTPLKSRCGGAAAGENCSDVSSRRRASCLFSMEASLKTAQVEQFLTATVPIFAGKPHRSAEPSRYGLRYGLQPVYILRQ
jgi:hypothetical protein